MNEFEEAQQRKSYEQLPPSRLEVVMIGLRISAKVYSAMGISLLERGGEDEADGIRHIRTAIAAARNYKIAEWVMNQHGEWKQQRDIAA
jgi:hypothetical protein